MQKDTSNLQILLIENDPEDVVLLRDILSRQNGHKPHFELIHAASLEDGLHYLQHEPIDVVLLDLMLPGGTESLIHLRMKTNAVPIVVLTPFNDTKGAAEVVSLGAQDYLVKGQVSYSVLSRTLLHAIERQKIHHEHLSLANELRRANVRLEKLVYSDYLTDLMNRRGLQEALSREIQRSMRGQSELLALILDLDNFKDINDTLGYAVGDIVLKEIAKTLTRSVRVTDYVTRIGGDEFLILMPDTRLGEGARMAEKVRRDLEEAVLPLSMGSAVRVTASFGLMRVPPATLSIDELFAQAHFILQKSKKMGKNRVAYAAENDLENYAKNEVANILGALRHGRNYQIVKQPIFDLVTREMTGYEFLSRFTAPGLEMPDEFFPGLP